MNAAKKAKFYNNVARQLEELKDAYPHARWRDTRSDPVRNVIQFKAEAWPLAEGEGIYGDYPAELLSTNLYVRKQGEDYPWKAEAQIHILALDDFIGSGCDEGYWFSARSKTPIKAMQALEGAWSEKHCEEIEKRIKEMYTNTKKLLAWFQERADPFTTHEDRRDDL